MENQVGADHLADVRRYDAGADAQVVDRIVKHLGIALRSRDSALVSCSDERELQRIRKGWCAKKLRIRDMERAQAAIARVCATMSGDAAKDRVTFYYLVAKHLRRLDML